LRGFELICYLIFHFYDARRTCCGSFKHRVWPESCSPDSSGNEWPLYIQRLRLNKELSAVTRQLNRLLDHPEHRQLAIDAFKRIGLWHDDLVMPRRLAVSEFGGQLASKVRVVDVPTHDRLRDEMGHLLEIDEPMAAAAAQLSGLHVTSETEEALARATEFGSPAKK
jgi:hypothetical protein